MTPEKELLIEIAQLIEDVRDIYPEEPPRLDGISTPKIQQIADLVRPYRKTT